MKNFKLSRIFDFIFFVSATFLICFVWTRYFVYDVALTLVLSSSITFLLTSIYHIFYVRKTIKKNHSLEELQNAEKFATHFLLSTKQEIIKEFNDKFEAKYNTKAKSDYLLVNDKVLKPIYSSQKITDKDILEIYVKVKNTALKKLIIVCCDAEQSAYDFAKLITNFEVVILTKLDAYKNIFEPLKFDIPNVNVPKKRKNLNIYLSIAFNKARTKNYAVVSAFLLFSSYVFRYNIYYLIFSSITAALALYSHFNTKFNNINKSEMI